ncbi:MAG: hypothetical protein KJ879_00060 [Nanoarchaeota archaeon]|nr:hypothetical protein [Nanoarchaeota archaeon]
MIKNKKGFLLAEETLKIIVAVIAIGFLAYLLFSIYGANQDAKNLELAKASLDSLETAINTQQTEVMIYNPKGWWIASWPYSDEGTTLMPNSCSNLGWENCLCIFPAGWTTFRPNGYKQDSDNGACAQMPKETIVSPDSGSQAPLKINKVPLTLKINYGDKITIIN